MTTRPDPRWAGSATCIGRHIGVSDSKPAGSTPTIVAAPSSNRIDRPMTPGSPPKWLRQYALLRSRTGGALGVMSSALNGRPRIGAAPKTVR